MKIIFRNLRRNLTFSLINITGLVIGITASILIFLWVYNERNYDRYHADADRIYKIVSTLQFEGSDPWVWETTPYPFVKKIKMDIPEVENMAVMFVGENVDNIKVKDEIFPLNGKATYVDKGWFEIFDYKLVDGSFEAFGDHPFSMALTESEARKLFGTTHVVGQTVSIENSDYMIRAVVRDHPSNSSFSFSYMASFNSLLNDSARREYFTDWRHANCIAFVKVRPAANIQQVEKKMIDALEMNKEITIINLTQLKDIYFETGPAHKPLMKHGDRRTVSVFTMLGILLLFTACINYINLTTAKASLRAKEVGIKKIVGAGRKTLFVQFISESFVVSTLSVFISLLALWVLSPAYHLLVENAVLSFSSPVIWIILGFILLVITLLNGIYPALTLSSFHPMNALKGMSLKIKDANLRKGLVVFQFTLSAALIIGVLVIYKQMQYVRTMNPGYNREQVFRINPPYKALHSMGTERVVSAMESFKNAIQSQTGIAGVTLCSHDIVSVESRMRGGSDWEGRPQDFDPETAPMSVDVNYMQFFGLDMVDGRWFEHGNKQDENNVILNETAVKELKIMEPYIGQRFSLLGRDGKIIGIVKDYHFKNLHEKIGSLILYNSPNYNYMINLKAQAGMIPQAMESAKKVFGEFFPDAPFDYAFLDDTFHNLYKSDTKTSQLILVFSILAIIIALLGLFGLSTFAIERRTKEIGIRKILGASVSGIIHLLTKEFLILVAIAFIIATPISWWAMNKWLENFAYRVSITAWIFIAGGVLTLIVALFAVSAQATKAATANPVKAIKSE